MTTAKIRDLLSERRKRNKGDAVLSNRCSKNSGARDGTGGAKRCDCQFLQPQLTHADFIWLLLMLIFN